ncbi:MAG TPA: YIP1 family protein, partial [Rhodanobacter sp.]
AIYAIYLLYLGLPQTMRCPPEKAGVYTAVSVIIAIVLSWIVGLLVAGTIGTAALGGAPMSGAHIIGATGDRVTLDGNRALGRLAVVGQRAEPVGKELGAARKSGDSTAHQAAMAR